MLSGGREHFAKNNPLKDSVSTPRALYQNIPLFYNIDVLLYYSKTCFETMEIHSYYSCQVFRQFLLLLFFLIITFLTFISCFSVEIQNFAYLRQPE